MAALRIDDTGFGSIRLIQDTDYFCYGTDAVLLADFASRNRHVRAADLGTNNAVIPLIMSEISDIEYFAGIEFHADAAALAERNVRENGLADRIGIFHCDILNAAEHFEAAAFDAVTANPPYFPGNAGSGNGHPRLHAARHETTASLDDFVRCAAFLLRPGGAFYMIHRPERLVDIFSSCRNADLEPKVMRLVCPHAGEPPNMVLLECRRKGGRELKIMPALVVRSEDGTRSDELMKIYRQADAGGRHELRSTCRTVISGDNERSGPL